MSADGYRIGPGPRVSPDFTYRRIDAARGGGSKSEKFAVVRSA